MLKGSCSQSDLGRLRKSFRSNVQRYLLLTAELLKLLDLFAVHGIDAIAFKGPVLAAAVYEDLSPSISSVTWMSLSSGTTFSELRNCLDHKATMAGTVFHRS